MHITKSGTDIARVRINAEQRSCFKMFYTVDLHSRDTFIWDLQIRVKCKDKDILEKMCSILEGKYIEDGSVPDTLALNADTFVMNEFCVIRRNEYEITAVPDGIYRYDIWEKTFCMNSFTLFVRNFIRAGVMTVFGNDIEIYEDVG